MCCLYDFDEKTDGRIPSPPSGYELCVLNFRGHTVRTVEVGTYEEVLAECRRQLPFPSTAKVLVYQGGKRVATCDLERARFLERVRKYNEGV